MSLIGFKKKRNLDEIYEKDLLVFANGRTLTVPHAHKTSPNRGILEVAGQNQSIGLINPEVPRFESLFTNGLLRSSFNRAAETDKEILHVIPKIVGGVPTCKTSYIYKEISTGKIGYFEFNKYIGLAEDFGFINESDIEKKKVGDILRSDEFMQKSINYKEDGICSGRNLRVAHIISPDTIEDSILISSKVREEMAYYKIGGLSLTMDCSVSMLRDLYGDDETYKPFPSVGNFVNNRDTVLAISDYNQGHQFIKPKKAMSKVSINDTTYHLEDGSMITDIEVLSASPTYITDEYLKSIYNDNIKYVTDIYNALNDLYQAGNELDFDAFYTWDRCKGMSGNHIGKTVGYRKDKATIPENHVLINISYYKECELEPGAKMTNRYGGKGVENECVDESYEIKDVFEHGMYLDENGEPIDIFLNLLGVPNRSNPAQLDEKTINDYYDKLIFAWAKTKRDAGELDYELFSNILSELTHILLPDMYELCKERFKKKEILDEIIDRDIILYGHPWPQEGWHPVYKDNTLLRMTKAYKLLKDNGIPIGKSKIYRKNLKTGELLEMPFKLEVGRMYFRLLEYTAKKKYAARTKGAYDSKGSLSKTQDKKNKKVRHSNTPVKTGERDLAMIASMLGSDIETIAQFLRATDTETVETLVAFFNSLGFGLKIDEEIEERLKSYFDSLDVMESE